MLWKKTHVCASVLPRISAIVVPGLSHDSLIDCMRDVLVLHSVACMLSVGCPHDTHKLSFCFSSAMREF